MNDIALTLPNDKEFKLFQQMILQRLGIHVPEQKRSLVGNRLWKRLQARNLNRFQEYYELINQPNEQAELTQALELLTTNETYFFREPRHFDFLRDQVLPASANSPNLRIWSAACSSGEEIYSIAMLLADLRSKGNWELLGSDVNQTMLDKAGKGIYPQERAQQIPDAYRLRFCRKGTGPFAGQLRVVPELRQRIRLQRIQLHENFPDIGRFDVVFLRNVMIYFDDKTRCEVVKRVIKVLNPNGYLFVGHAESLHGLQLGLKQVMPAVYQCVP